MEGYSIKSFENLCKIFEMRIKLDKEKNIETPEDVLINYEKYCKKIDAFYNDEFEDSIKTLISPSITLEEEEKRLKKLIKAIENRIDKREELENKFYLATDRKLKNLQMIISSSELDEKKKRLDIISKYLNTNREIDSITESIAKLKNSLSLEEEKKEEYESKNNIMEDELCSLFIDVFKKEEYFKDIDDFSLLLNDIIDKVKETKETLDVTKDSVSSLALSGADSEDYASYIDDAEKNYFVWKNREILLKIYELVINIHDDFRELFDKREKIKLLLKERKLIREELNIDNNDDLSIFEKNLINQIITINSEKELIENISSYTSRINFKEDRLNELEKENNDIEVLAILREYGIIDTYDSEEINDDSVSLIEKDIKEESDTSSIESIIDDSKLDDVVVKEVFDPYRIVSVKDYPKTLNIGLAKLKGESVRDKVNKKLNPQKEEINFDYINMNFDKDILSSDSKIEEDKNDFISPISLENNEEDKKEDLNNIESPKEEISVPTWEIPVDEKEETSNSIPAWELPTEEKEEVSNNIPVWGEVISDNSEKPILEEAKPIEDDSNKIEKPMQNEFFWTTAFDEKLDTNAFPNINIPISSSKEDFDFPNMNE